MRSTWPVTLLRVKPLAFAGLLGLLLWSVLGLIGRPAALGAGSWNTTGSMKLARSHAAAALLPDGRVLVAGGESGNGPSRAITPTAEVYDPASGIWSFVADMSQPREDLTATTLTDGRVLVVGGQTGFQYLSSAEIFSPKSGTWSSAGSMSTARSSHTATLLKDGRVLVVGGFGPQGPLTSAEIYNPATNAWTTVQPMQVARGNHAATLLSDGEVLVTGGFGVNGALSSVERYDPTIDRWAGFQPLQTMSQARYSHTATLLKDGRVLVAGGFGPGGSLASAELYNPGSGAWTPAASMSVPRGLHTASLLPNGEVLVAGGDVQSGGSGVTTDTAELYDPGQNAWTSAGQMLTGRSAHVAVTLNTGQVLVAGGTYGAGVLDIAELFTLVIVPTATPVPVRTSTPTPPPSAVPPTPSPTRPPTSTPVPTAPPIATPTQPATPLFRILGVRVEHVGERPDWQLERPTLKQITVDTSIRLSLYARFTYLPGIAHVNVTADVKLKGRVVYHAGVTEDRAGAGDVWDHWSYTPRALGKYVFTASVKIGSRTRTASISFTAVKPARAPSFTFDRLQTFDAAGHPSSSFSRTARVVVVATFTVRNAVGSVSVIAGQTLERPAGNRWVALGKRVQNSFVTTNGTYPYSVSFYPQSPYSRLRMVIDLQLGREKAGKSVEFQVHG